MSLPPAAGSRVRFLIAAAVIAALYAALTAALAPISFLGVQLRVAEALTVLPLFTTAAIPGLALGCALANLVGVAMGANPAGLLDVPVGAAATLLAAFLTYLFRNIRIGNFPVLSFAPPVAVNMLVIGTELSLVLSLPLPLTVLQVGAGQFGACAGIGVPLYLALRKTGALEKIRVPGAVKPRKRTN